VLPSEQQWEIPAPVPTPALRRQSSHLQAQSPVSENSDFHGQQLDPPSQAQALTSLPSLVCALRLSGPLHYNYFTNNIYRRLRFLKSPRPLLYVVRLKDQPRVRSHGWRDHLGGPGSIILMVMTTRLMSHLSEGVMQR